MGSTFCALGRISEAADIYRRWLSMDPHCPEAHHLLAGCCGRQVPERASDAYLRATFERFAPSYDATLAALDYRAPALVAAALNQALAGAGGAGRRYPRFDVLDAGCGTGLCAPLLRPHARRLIGADLSAAMLARADALGLYDELAEAEISSYLAKRFARLDVVAAADALVYFGDLSCVLLAVASALRPGGILVFTAEHERDPAAAPQGFRLYPHGRYGHTDEYVRRTITTAGLALTSLERHDVRRERHAPVPGLVVTARKDP
jgi:predicted TPR repeat methyltransferase